MIGLSQLSRTRSDVLMRTGPPFRGSVPVALRRSVHSVPCDGSHWSGDRRASFGVGTVGRVLLTGGVLRLFNRQGEFATAPYWSASFMAELDAEDVQQ